MTTNETVLLIETPFEGCQLLRLNRPDKRNALATILLVAIADALDAATLDPAVRCVILTGSERIFAAGADIAELQSKDAISAMVDVRPMVWARIRSFPKPLIAAVEGWALGAGNELAMSCDIVVAGRSARFGQPETNLGIIPGAGGTSILPRLVGKALAMKMVLLGETITAEQALQAGLVSDVVDDTTALTFATELAARISARAPIAMQQGKASVKAAFETTLAAHLLLERQAFAMLFGTKDKDEGISAFLDKRAAIWRGH